MNRSKPPARRVIKKYPNRREFYNESVNLLNVRIEQFPDALIAGLFGFAPHALLRFAEEEKSDVDIKALFDA